MKIIIKKLFIFFLIACVIYCSERKRLNPIDPLNPKTGGRPQNIEIYSELNTVIIKWKGYDLDNFRGYRIYRQNHSDSLYHLIETVPPDSHQFIDRGLNYNQTYAYFVTILGGDFETPSSDTVSVKPGPTFIWGTDVYNRRILKLTHDGSHEIFQIPVDGYPWELAYDGETQTLWFTDIFLNRLYTIKSNSQAILADFKNGEPIDIALDNKNDRIWVADETQGKIFVFNREGETIGEKGGFQKPVSLDYFWKDGSCWVADSKAGRIIKISKSLGIVLSVDNLKSPTSISVNQQNGFCWVADSSRIVLFDNRGETVRIIDTGIVFPKHVAVDSELGYCWVLDFRIFAYQSLLCCFDENGEKIIELSGLSWPENVAVNPYDHSCIVADSGAGRVLKISLDGKITGQVTGYNYTHGLFVEYLGTK